MPEIGGAVKGDGMLLQYAGPHVQGLQMQTDAAFLILPFVCLHVSQYWMLHRVEQPRTCLR